MATAEEDLSVLGCDVGYFLTFRGIWNI